MALPTWVFTVSTDTPSRSAIELFLRPLDTAATTSSSPPPPHLPCLSNQANSNTNAPAELRFGGFGKHNGKNIEVVFRHKYRSGKDNSVQVRRAAAQ